MKSRGTAAQDAAPELLGMLLEHPHALGLGCFGLCWARMMEELEGVLLQKQGWSHMANLNTLCAGELSTTSALMDAGQRMTF